MSCQYQQITILFKREKSENRRLISMLNSDNILSGTVNNKFSWSNYAQITCTKIGILNIVMCKFSSNPDGILSNTDILGAVPDSFKPKRTAVSISASYLYGTSSNTAIRYSVPTSFFLDVNGNIKASIGSQRIYDAFFVFIY